MANPLGKPYVGHRYDEMQLHVALRGSGAVVVEDSDSTVGSQKE